MTIIEYIRLFLHDTESTRWQDSYLEYLVQLAKKKLTVKGQSFLNQRSINRDLAYKNSMLIKDDSVDIQLLDGQSTYNLPDYLKLKSVRYNNIYIRHGFDTTKLSASNDEFQPFRYYNVEGEKKGVITIIPTPSTKMPILVDSEQDLILVDYFNYACEFLDSTTNYCPEVEVDPCCPTEKPCLNIKEGFIPIEDVSIYGWGLVGDISTTEIYSESQVTTPCEDVTEETETENNCPTEEEIVESFIDVNLGKLHIIYESKQELNFPDNSQELLDELLSEEELIKNFVCGTILRSDEDAHSRTLGETELKLFEEGFNIIINKYIDNYDVNDKLEILGYEQGNYDIEIDKKLYVNTSLLDQDKQDLEKARIEKEIQAIKLEERAISIKEQAIKLDSSKINLEEEKVRKEKVKEKHRNCDNKYDEITYKGI